MSILVTLVLSVLRSMSLEPERLALAWARVMPAVILVPAFGLRALPNQVRGVFALMLALVVAPAIAIPSGGAFAVPWPAALVGEVLAGLPIAVSAAVPLWAATMVGGVLDQARGQSEATSMPLTEGRATMFGHFYSMIAAVFFLYAGGAARVAEALIHPAASGGLLGAKDAILSGVHLALAIGAPVLAAQIVVETASALIARAASPSNVQALLAPFRSVAILAVCAVSLDRVAHAFALFAAR
jgi:type III secretory pathway component EscT